MVKYDFWRLLTALGVAAATLFLGHFFFGEDAVPEKVVAVFAVVPVVILSGYTGYQLLTHSRLACHLGRHTFEAYGGGAYHCLYCPAKKEVG